MKRFLKSLFYSTSKPNRILSGVSAGMYTHYDPKDRTLHLLGLYEREIYPFLKSAIRKAKTLVDVGANDGYYGLAFARHKGKEVLLCEPSAEESVKLIDNLKLNNFEVMRDFKLIDKFVTDRTDQQNISLNDLLKGKTDVLVLIDVDGGELKILESYNFESSIKIEWLIETHTKQLEDSIEKLLLAQGYVVTIIKSAWWRIIFPERRPLPHNRWLFASKDRG